jgi:hypothetical protein
VRDLQYNCQRRGDIAGELRALLGKVQLTILRGNPPAARVMLRRTLRRARAANLTHIRSRALHAMAEIAVRENEFDLAARIGFRALSLCKEGTERDRILGDIAHAFARMRAFDAARDAYLAIASRSREQWVRWAAYINLLDIEASVRDRRAFDRYDKILSRSKLTPELAVWYRLTVGEGLLLFDEPVAARDHLQRALCDGRGVRL